MSTDAVVRPFWIGGGLPAGLEQPVGLSDGMGGYGTPASAAIAFGGQSGDGRDLTPIPMPNTPATNYSWLQQLYFGVTVPASPATTLRDATVSLRSALPDGLRIFYRTTPNVGDLGISGVDNPPPVLTEDAGQPSVPTGYAILTTTPVIWEPMGIVDNGGTVSHSDEVTGYASVRVSSFLNLVMGVSSTYAGPLFEVQTFFDLVLSYSEST